VYILGDLHPVGGKSRLGIYYIFLDDYIAFVPGNVTELQSV